MIPELKRLIARFPEYPTLRNFLRIVHVVRQNHRQAEEVIRDLAEQHPNYLYSRLGLAEEVLNNQRPPELVLQHLGQDLDIIREGLREAPRPPAPQTDIFEMYRRFSSYGSDPHDEDAPEDDIADFRPPGGGSPLYDLPGISTGPEVGRNDPCPCGSGKKYKKCCMK